MMFTEPNQIVMCSSRSSTLRVTEWVFDADEKLRLSDASVGLLSNWKWAVGEHRELHSATKVITWNVPLRLTQRVLLSAATKDNYTHTTATYFLTDLDRSATAPPRQPTKVWYWIGRYHLYNCTQKTMKFHSNNKNKPRPSVVFYMKYVIV